MGAQTSDLFDNLEELEIEFFQRLQKVCERICKDCPDKKLRDQLGFLCLESSVYLQAKHTFDSAKNHTNYADLKERWIKLRMRLFYCLGMTWSDLDPNDVLIAQFVPFTKLQEDILDHYKKYATDEPIDSCKTMLQPGDPAKECCD